MDFDIVLVYFSVYLILGVCFIFLNYYGIYFYFYLFFGLNFIFFFFFFKIRIFIRPLFYVFSCLFSCLFLCLFSLFISLSIPLFIFLLIFGLRFITTTILSNFSCFLILILYIGFFNAKDHLFLFCFLLSIFRIMFSFFRLCGN